MSLFTIVMVVDIFMFGEKMRTEYLRGAFGWPGRRCSCSSAFCSAPGGFWLPDALRMFRRNQGMQPTRK
jgi:hypothetical protein